VANCKTCLASAGFLMYRIPDTIRIIVKNIFIKYVIIITSICIFTSCAKKEESLSFEQFNKIVSESLIYSIENDCYNFLPNEMTYKTKIMGLVRTPLDSIRLDSTIKFTNFDLKMFITNSKNLIFLNDTFSMAMNENYKFCNTDLKELSDFGKYHSRFKENDLDKQKISFIKTFLICNPRFKKQGNTNQILVNIIRVFEYFETVCDRTYLLITTDKSFNILNIECLKQVKPYIPFPPKPVKGRKNINPDTIKIDW